MTTANPYAGTDSESIWADGYQYGQQNPIDPNPTAPAFYDSDSAQVWQGGATAGQQDAQGNSPDSTIITLPETTIVAIPPASLRDHIATLGYYEARAYDFVYRNPGQTPPDYYMFYGDKYANRFKTDLRPSLSPAGQAWVDCTLVALQTAIEDRRDANPWAFAELEQDNDAFRAFAFDTHPDAYIGCGICDLPVIDEGTIALTPDFKDILTLGGLRQIKDSLVQCGVVWLEEWAGSAPAP
jgi:hypothetical protein